MAYDTVGSHTTDLMLGPDYEYNEVDVDSRALDVDEFLCF